MKFLEFNSRITKIKNFNFSQCQKNENDRILKISLQNNENYKNVIIKLQNNENHKILTISRQNHENHLIKIYSTP